MDDNHQIPSRPSDSGYSNSEVHESNRCEEYYTRIVDLFEEQEELTNAILEEQAKTRTAAEDAIEILQATLKTMLEAMKKPKKD